MNDFVFAKILYPTLLIAFCIIAPFSSHACSGSAGLGVNH